MNGRGTQARSYYRDRSRGWLQRCSWSAVLLILGWSLSSPVWGEEAHYELRGQVLTEKGMAFRSRGAVVFLQAATGSYTSWKSLGLDGSFKFEKLFPGPYVLTIAVPRLGELSRTVAIGPTLADAKGRIREKIVLGSELTRRPDHTVTAQALMVPKQAKEKYRQAQKRLERHDVSGAVEYLEEAVRIAPDFSAGWNNLGTIAYHRRDYDGAEHFFQKALEGDGRFYPALVNMGGVLLAQVRAKEALPFNRSAVEARPTDPLAHSQLGRNYFELGDAAGAEKHLRHAKTLDARHFTYPQLLLAQIYQLRKDYRAAVAELEEYLLYHPDSETAPEVQQRLERLALLMEPRLEPETQNNRIRPHSGSETGRPLPASR